MGKKGFLIKVFLFSTIIVLATRWISKPNTQRVISVTYRPPTKTTPRTRIPIIRQSVTLNDGPYKYHLNLTSFEAEFPYLQSYNCTLIQEPHPEEHGATNQRLLILAVKSHPARSTGRVTLRQMWARERNINGYRLRPLFLLGKTDVKGHMEIVKVESQAYSDILQWDMAEGHHNLSLKERCFLEWLYLKSPNVDFIFKGDDDEFVNLDAVTRYITEHGTPNTIHGFHQYRPSVLRSTKYGITKTLYPQDYYPGFVSGGGFLYPGASVKSLYAASQLLPVFPLDDVYFGFLALAAKLTYRHDKHFYVYGLAFDVCKYKQALVVHNVNMKDMVRLWQEVQDGKCWKNQSVPS
ncbi:beta-1,3-galactosyltransferase 5-like [Mantella aurantiaca]